MNKRLLADLDRVGRILDSAKKVGRKLSSMQKKEVGRVLSTAKTNLLALRATNKKATQKAIQKRIALYTSVKEGLMEKSAAKTELATIQQTIKSLYARNNSIKAALAGVRNLEAASPRLEELDKGVETSNQIKEPPKAGASKKTLSAKARIAKVKARIAARRKLAEDAQSGETISGDDRLENTNNSERPTLAPSSDAQSGEVIPGDTTQIDPGNVETLDTGLEGAPAPGLGSGDATSMASKKRRAKSMYSRAMKLIKEAEAEKDAKKKAAMKRRASILETMADKIVASVPAKRVAGKLTEAQRKAIRERIAARKAPAKTAAKPLRTLTAAQREEMQKRIAVRKKASTEKEAEIVTLAANDRVVLADGSVGSVKAIANDKVTVTIGGVDKEVLSSTVRKLQAKVEAKVEAKAEPVKTTSVVDRVRNAIKAVRGKKKTADGDVEPALSPDAPALEAPEIEAPEVQESGAGDTVAESEIKTIAINPENGKYQVNVTETEVLEFPDEPAAKEFMTMANKAKRGQYTMDSADPSTPEGAVDGQKKLKGLDQSGKDYGTTSKDQKVNPDRSMIGKASRRTGTTMNPGMPTDSSDKGRPEGEAVGQKVLKGLDQSGKGYSTTKPGEKVDPQFSMIKGKLASTTEKVAILAEANRKQTARLAEVESALLIDRAVKVGAIAEEQRGEQQAILAELYANSRADFRAYDRVISGMESQDESPGVKIANRKVRKVEASMIRKQSELVDAVDAAPGMGSLETGTFFED